MDLPDIEAWLRSEAEPLQYLAFFGSLVVLATLETLLPRRLPAARRGRWPANFGLTAINIAVLGALPLSALAVADYARQHDMGLLNDLALPAGAALVLGVLARSLISYVVHVAMHKVPLFWRVHRVHHTDPFFDVSTTVRFHPLEFVISTPIALAAILTLGISPLAVILYELFDAAMAVWTHANIRLPVSADRRLGWLFVTPDMHRIHHSAWQPETDSNYGATFSLWDRAFGTLRSLPAEKLSELRLGVDDGGDANAGSLRRMLVAPFTGVAGRPAGSMS